MNGASIPAWESVRMARKRELSSALGRAGVPAKAANYEALMRQMGIRGENEIAILRSVLVDRIFQLRRNEKGTMTEEALLSWLWKR